MFSEPNDTIFNATSTGLSSATPGTFSTTGTIGDNPFTNSESDVDFFQVQLDEDSRLIIDIDANEFGSSLDSIVRLFDANGNNLVTSDDAPAPGESWSFDSFVDFTTSATGDYFIGISGYDNFSYNPFSEGSGFGFRTGDYTVTVTITSPTVNDIIGTSRRDVLRGTERPDRIWGLGGNDTITALGGRDQIFGDDGADIINAGAGNDTAEGGRGNDQIAGGAGNDLLSGGDGVDVIFGEEDGSFDYGNDQISGGAGGDRLFGGYGDDQINGDDGNDNIVAGDGYDIASGGSGSDRLFGGYGDDILNGDAGNDELNGDFGYDTLNGGDGADSLFGGYDSDTLNGNNGADRLIGVHVQTGDGNSFGAYEVDTLMGGEGRDTFVLGDANHVYYDDGDSFRPGEYDYARITDFNARQDFIQLKGSAEFYYFDFFRVGSSTNAALIFDTDEARGETIAILENVSRGSLNLSSRAFVYV